MSDQEIIDLEHAWMNAWVAGDRATMERILAPDFQLTSALGRRMTGAEWLEAALGPIRTERFTWESLEVRPVGTAGDVAVVHGRANQRGRADGREWGGAFLVTDVWVRREGRWQVVARHGSALPGHAP